MSAAQRLKRGYPLSPKQEAHLVRIIAGYGGNPLVVAHLRMHLRNLRALPLAKVPGVRGR